MGERHHQHYYRYMCCVHRSVKCTVSPCSCGKASFQFNASYRKDESLSKRDHIT